VLITLVRHRQSTNPLLAYKLRERERRVGHDGDATS
jgi:hypothetical protein